MRIAGRPFGILALAALMVIGALWSLAGVAGLRAVPEFSIKGLEIAPDIVRLVVAAWSAAMIAGAVLLVALRREGWLILMIGVGLALLASLWQWFLGNPEPIRLALLVVSAFYLNGRQARELLLESTRRADVAPLAPPEGGTR